MPLTPFLQNTKGISQPSPAGLSPLPGPFSARYTRVDVSYDYAIGGIPFLAGEGGRGTYFRRIYNRTFSPIRKDQFDNQQVPGEQSIWGWWLRSQSDFIQGAGVQFLDTTQDTSLAQRYFYSEGLDTLSTPGQVTLLQQATEATGLAMVGTHLKLRSVQQNGADGVLVWDNLTTPKLKFYSTAGAVVNYTLPALGGSQQVSFTDDGTNYYIAAANGIFKGVINTPATPAVAIWTLPALSAGNVVQLGWVKGRLVACIYNSVYELVGGSPPTLPTPKFTHQNPNYLFSDISETQTAILVSGSALLGFDSKVHRFTLDSGGALPTLTSGVVAASMPAGEKILSMFAYIGAFVGLGTNKGFRVATIDVNGNLTYGPLIVQDPTNVGVVAITGYDRFLFIGNQGNKLIPQAGWVNPPEAASTDGIMRVDLSQQTSTGALPFANDLMPLGMGGYVASSGNVVNSIAMMGQTSGIAWTVGNKVYVSVPTFKVPTGFMYTPRVRYNTLEPKHFKFIYLRHEDITDGSIDVYGQNPTKVLTSIATSVTGSSTSGSAAPFYISDIGNAQEWFQFKFILHAGTIDPNKSPILNGYQLRSLPGVSRQVLIEVPLLCFDHEDDKYGDPHGTDGFAYQRIKAVEALTASGNIVLFQDLNYNDSNLVIVDDYKFEQQSPELAKAASANNQDSNAHGGYLILKCRVIV